jgi:hypothetical protein
MLRKRFFQRAFEKVDHFISPSAYLAERFIEWGIPRAKMSVIAERPSHQPPGGLDARAQRGSQYLRLFRPVRGREGHRRAACRPRAPVAEATDKPVEVKIFGGNKSHASPDYLAADRQGARGRAREPARQ